LVETLKFLEKVHKVQVIYLRSCTNVPHFVLIQQKHGHHEQFNVWIVHSWSPLLVCLCLLITKWVKF